MPKPRPKVRVKCCICGKLIGEGHLHPQGLQCETCYKRHEAHKAAG